VAEVLLTANRRAFSAFDGFNSEFRVGGCAAAGVTNACEVSSLWDFADAALIWLPVSRKRTPGALGAWGVVASTEVPDRAAWATTNPVRA
jgi:hypothetical protein